MLTMVRGVCVEEFQRVEGERYAMEAQLLQEQAAHLATQADLGTVQGELAEAQARGGDLEGTCKALETSLHQERAQVPRRDIRQLGCASNPNPNWIFGSLAVQLTWRSFWAVHLTWRSVWGGGD
jgi:hypothetical protein